MTWLIVLIVVVLVVLVLELKTTRPDGTLCRVHPYRRALGFIMPGRNESVVYFDSFVVADDLLEYIDEINERFEARLTHCIVAAVAVGMHEVPQMNRFIAGYREYQRTGRWLSFSVKKKKLDKKARLSALKLQMLDDESFAGLCERINDHVNVERSGKRTSQDKEMDLLNKVPRPLFAFAFKAVRWLDYFNLVPGWFIDGDGMHTSCFIANLGSVGMKAGYHHLYEWGTSPLFLMVGKIEERPWVVDGEVVVRKILHLRWSYDERIDDGMTAGSGINAVLDVLNDPRQRLACLAEDGSDDIPLIETRDRAAQG